MNNKKKIILGFFAFLVIATIYNNFNQKETSNQNFAGGNGTKSDPFQIENVKQLNMIREYLDQNFVLIQDIDLKEVDNFKPIGSEDTPFKGVLDGSGKSIKNLKINRPDEEYVGLFGFISDKALIKNICLENVNIRGNIDVGGLSGHVKNSDIKNSCVTGNITGKSYTGGMVGYNKGRLHYSYTNVKVSGDFIIGGLVGYNSGSDKHEVIILNSYAMGKVKGNKNVGGLVGRSVSKIQSSYSVTKVEGRKMVGGFLGYNHGKVIATKNVYGNIVGQNYWERIGNRYLKGIGQKAQGSHGNSNVLRKTSKQLKNSVFQSAGWDKDIWVFEKGKYPRLFWEK